MNQYTVRVFFGHKILGEEVLQARGLGLAQRDAKKVAMQHAQKVIPNFMYRADLVEWAVLEVPVAAA